MGAAMAANLARAGFPLTVWNRTPGRAGAAGRPGRRGGGALPASSSAPRATSSSSASRTRPTSRPSCSGADGVAAGLALGGLVIDCSTISPAATPRVRGSASQRRRSALRRCAGLGRLGGRPEGHADDHGRRLGRRRRARHGRSSRRHGQGRSRTWARSARARRPRPSTRSSWRAPTSASPRASCWPSRPASIPSRSSTALSGGAARSWVLENRSGRMIADDYPLGFRIALHLKDVRHRPGPGPRGRRRPARRRAGRARSRPASWRRATATTTTRRWPAPSASGPACERRQHRASGPGRAGPLRRRRPPVLHAPGLRVRCREPFDPQEVVIHDVGVPGSRRTAGSTLEWCSAAVRVAAAPARLPSAAGGPSAATPWLPAAARLPGPSRRPVPPPAPRLPAAATHVAATAGLPTRPRCLPGQRLLRSCSARVNRLWGIPWLE